MTSFITTIVEQEDPEPSEAQDDVAHLKNLLASIEHVKRQQEVARMTGKQGLIDHYGRELKKWNAALSTHKHKVLLKARMKAATEAGYKMAEQQRKQLEMNGVHV